MIYPIEYEGKAVEFKQAGQFNIAGFKTETGFQPLPAGCSVSVCSWCVPPTKQQPLRNGGFALSHGICRDCIDKQKWKEESHYE